MKKGIAFFTAYLLPFIIIFWGRTGLLFNTATSVNVIVLIVALVIFLLWRSKTSKNMLRLNEGDPRINWYRIFNYMVIFILGAGFVYYISEIAMAWHYILLVIGGSQILAEFIEMSYYKD